MGREELETESPSLLSSSTEERNGMVAGGIENEGFLNQDRLNKYIYIYKHCYKYIYIYTRIYDMGRGEGRIDDR